jgi:Flp pilus assembly protein protease CpaA
MELAEIPLNLGVITYAFFEDIRVLRIPNWITLGGTALLLGIRGLLSGNFPLGTVIMFFIGFFLFALVTGGNAGLTGLGDAKLAGYMSASFGTNSFFRILIYSGALLFLFKGIKEKEKLPLGLCVCAAALAEMLTIIVGIIT